MQPQKVSRGEDSLSSSSRCILLILPLVPLAAPHLSVILPKLTMPTFYDRFRECAERWPTNVALEIQKHDRLERFTYSELCNMAEAITSWILQNGHKPGDRIAILADNHPRWVASFLGIIAA